MIKLLFSGRARQYACIFFSFLILTSCARDVVQRTDNEWVPQGSKDSRTLTNLLATGPVEGFYAKAVANPDTLVIAEWCHTVDSWNSKENVPDLVIDSLCTVVAQQANVSFELGSDNWVAFGNSFVHPSSQSGDQIPFVGMLIPGGIGGGSYILIDTRLVPEQAKDRTTASKSKKAMPTPAKYLGGQQP